MKKIVIVYGLILGAILSTNAVIMMTIICKDPTFKSNDPIGYTAMLVVLSIIFFGIRNYRNTKLGGVITFAKAFKAGLLITLVASTLYVIIGLTYYYVFVPDFMDRFIEHVLHQCTTESELVEKTKEMASFKEMYKNPLWAVLLTYAEVFPLGLIVTLISSLILRTKKSQ